MPSSTGSPLIAKRTGTSLAASARNARRPYVTDPASHLMTSLPPWHAETGISTLESAAGGCQRGGRPQLLPRPGRPRLPHAVEPPDVLPAVLRGRERLPPVAHARREVPQL